MSASGFWVLLLLWVPLLPQVTFMPLFSGAAVAMGATLPRVSRLQLISLLSLLSWVQLVSLVSLFYRCTCVLDVLLFMAVPGVFVSPGGLGVSVITGAAHAMVAALATIATGATVLRSFSCHWC